MADTDITLTSHWLTLNWCCPQERLRQEGRGGGGQELGGGGARHAADRPDAGELPAAGDGGAQGQVVPGPGGGGGEHGEPDPGAGPGQAHQGRGRVEQ